MMNRCIVLKYGDKMVLNTLNRIVFKGAKPTKTHKNMLLNTPSINHIKEKALNTLMKLLLNTLNRMVLKGAKQQQLR